MIGSENYTGEVEQPNHEQLHQFLSVLLTSTEAVELYGCRDGDFQEVSAGHESILVDRILDSAFFFRERYGYIVNRSEQAASPNRSSPPSQKPTSPVRGSED